MRKKQLLAFLTAGALSVSMVSTAAFAAAEDGTEVLSMEEVTLEEETPEEEIQEEIPVEIPEEETSVENIENETTEGEQQQETQQQTQTQEVVIEEQAAPAAAEENVQTEATPAAVEKFSIKIGDKTYNTLADAVDAVSTSESTQEATQILVTGDIEITETVKIPAGKNITIVAAENTEIGRAAELKGSLFAVEGGTLTFSGSPQTETDGGAEQTAAYALSVDGSLESEVAVDGSVVEVTSGYFVLADGASIVNNKTTGNGGAVRNTADGTVMLLGGTIKGNTAAEGGAVYSEGVVAVQGTVNVSENYKASSEDQETPINNIVLKGDKAKITVTDALTNSKIGVSVVDPAAGKTVVELAEDLTDVTMEEVLTQITYEGGESFTINAEGKLQPTVTPEPSKKPTPTPTKKPTPTPTKKPTPTMAPLKVDAVSAKWLKYDSIRLVVSANRSGTYYVSWVPAGSAAPTIDTTKKDGDVVADYNFTVNVKDLPADPVDIYVCVMDEAGNYEATVFKTAGIEGRPAAPETPSPDYVPKTPAVTESVVRGLEKPLEFYPNTFYDFTVIGAGTENTSPGNGDVRWVPQYWSMSSNPSVSDRHETWKIGAAAGIRDAKTYNIYIFFQKQVFNGTQWQATDTVESVTYQFQSAAITISGTPTPSIEGQTGTNGTGTDGTGTDLTTTPAADNSGAAAGTERTAVATADESPVGSMMMLAAASLLAGGYVLVRRRKKEM